MSQLVGSRLARLIAIVDGRLLFQETLREVRQMRQWVLDAEHILSADFLREGSVVTNKLVAQRFDAWRAKLARLLRQEGLSEEQRAQPLSSVRLSGETATLNVEEGGDDVKSARPLRPGRHTRYNG